MKHRFFHKLIGIFLLLLTGCQTIAREFEGPVRYDEGDVKIEKVLSPASYEFAFTDIPYKDSSHLRLVCHRVRTVQGKKRVIIGHGKEIVHYNGWRELVEFPLLGPLSLIFLPFNLIGWLFGSEVGKNQALTSLYLLNPGQNAPLWGSEYVYEERPGEYQAFVEKKGKKVPLTWEERKSVDFTLQSAQIGKIKIPLKLSARGNTPLVLPLTPFAKELNRDLVALRLEGTVGKERVVGSLHFVFDDTPQVPPDKRKDPKNLLERANILYEVASHYYKDGDYKSALRVYHKAVSYYRALKLNPKDLPIDHLYFRSYLFRGLSRIRMYTRNLAKIEEVPQVVAWRAMKDLLTFSNLTPWHPQNATIHKYFPLLAKRVYGPGVQKSKLQKKGEQK